MPAAEATPSAEPRSRRWAVAALLAAALLAYAAWPLLTAASLLRAARNGDVAAIEAHVDFPRLRRSMARQIVREAVLLHPIQGPERQLALGVGTAALTAWLEELLTARTMADMMGGRSVPPPAQSAPVDLSAVRTAPLRGLIAIWWRSGFASPVRYELSLPDPEGSEALLVGMELRGAAWRVTRLELSDELRALLARRLVNLGAPKPAEP